MTRKSLCFFRTLDGDFQSWPWMTISIRERLAIKARKRRTFSLRTGGRTHEATEVTAALYDGRGVDGAGHGSGAA